MSETAQSSNEQRTPNSQPRRRWVVRSIAVVVLLIGLVVGWLVSTESGLRVGASVVRGILPAGVELGAVSGRLIGPLELAQVNVVADAAEVAITRIRIDWRPAALFSEVAHIDSIVVEGVEVRLLEPPPQESAEAFQLPEQLAAPVDFELESLKVVGVRIHQGEREFVVNTITASASWIDTQIEMPQFRLASPLVDLTVAAGISAAGDYPFTVSAEHSVRLQNLAPIVGTVSAAESLRHPQLLWQLEAPWSTQLTAEVQSLFSDPVLKAKLEMSPDSLAQLGQDLPAYEAQLSLRLNGAFDDLELTSSARLDGEDIPALDLDLVAHIQPTHIELDRIEVAIAGQPQPVIASGQVELLSEPHLDLALSWQQLLVPAQAAEQMMRVEAGQLQVSGPLGAYVVKGGMRVDYLGYETPLSISGNGSQAHFELEELTATLGELSRHRPAVDTQGNNPEDSAGQLVVNGRVDFGSDLEWVANVRGNNLNPGQYVADLPGSIALAMTARGAQTSEGVVSVTLPELTINGTLAAEALRVSGAGLWQGDRGLINKLDGHWGDYVLEADGALGPESDLTWSLAMPDLSSAGRVIGEAWQGSVRGDGKVLGSLASPRVVLNANVIEARVADVHMQSLQLRLDASLEGRLDVDLSLVGAQFAGQEVNSVDLDVSGTSTDHGLQLVIESAQADLSLDAQGSFNAGAKSAGQAWSFNLAKLDLLHPDLDVARVDHQWSLTAPVSGFIGLDAVQMRAFCLSHDVPVGGGSLCAEAAITKQATRASLMLDALRLDNLNGLLPDDVRLQGTLDGEALWTGQLAETQGQFLLDAMRVQVRDESSDNDGGWLAVASFAPGSILVQPQGNAIDIKVQLPLVESVQDGVFATLAVTPSTNPDNSTWPILGDVNISLPDLSWIAAFVEPLTSMTGGLSSDVALSGTLQEPLFSGESTLTLAAAELADLGLKLTETQLRLLGTQNGVELLGAANSGGGSLQLTSTVGWKDGLNVQGTMTGREFVVSDTPEARVSISPDLRVSYDNAMLTLRGDVAVPLAEIRLNKVPTGAVSASKDQRFLSEDVAPAPLESDVRVRLLLGDNVSFQGLGLDAKFAGALAIQDSTTKATTATGEIDIVEGAYKAYGQDLTINDGKVIFAGGPIEEPGLDVRALRQATPEVSVGVHVRGSLRQPELEVFSTPSLPQSDQLSYLVLGRPLSSSSASENSLLQQAAMAIGVQSGELFTNRIGKSLGVDDIGIESAPGTSNAQAALVVGKYLSPKLYVSYGYGLFEPISTLRLEYQLNRLWRVVTQSTNNATGGDFIWVHER